jgi:hypothetical protein
MIKAGDLIENNYLIGARISKGTFGELFIGRNIETGEKYAVKVQYGEIGAGLKVRSPSLCLLHHSLAHTFSPVGGDNLKTIK